MCMTSSKMICCSTHSSNLMVPTFFTVSNRKLLTLCTMKRISTNQSNEISRLTVTISQVSAELKTTPRRWRRTSAPPTRKRPVSRRAMLRSQTKRTHNQLFEAVEGLIHEVGCEDLTLRGRRLSQKTKH